MAMHKGIYGRRQQAEPLPQGWGQSRISRPSGCVTVWCRFVWGWLLQAEQGEGAQAGAVPAEVAAGGGVVGVAGAVEDAGDGVADGGEQAGGLPGTQPGGVFAEGDITPVMQAVLNSPVFAVAGEEEFRAGLGGGERGDGQDGLAGH